MTADEHGCLRKSGASRLRTATAGSQDLAEAERPLIRRRSQMTARHEPLPPERHDLQHQPASQDRLTRERDDAERHAWDALARYKFVMFGYWCGIWVHLNRLCATPKPNPWRDLVAAARRHRRRHDEDRTTQPGRP